MYKESSIDEPTLIFGDETQQQIVPKMQQDVLEDIL